MKAVWPIGKWKGKMHRQDPTRKESGRDHRALVFNTLLAASGLSILPNGVLAGPPFQTDDPEPVDLGHYEFYIFSGSDSDLPGDFRTT